MDDNPDEQQSKPFNLVRRIGLLGFASIALWSILSAAALSYFLVQEILRRDAEVTSSFIQSVLTVEETAHYFADTQTQSARATLINNPKEPAAREALEQFFNHVATLPDVLLANVFNQDRAIIWSSNPKLVGKRFENNEELEEAFSSQLVIENGRLEGNTHKPEQLFLGDPKLYFVENYIPILDKDKHRVVGVVEVYKEPRALFESINKGIKVIWIATLAGAIVLFCALFWIARRANRVMVRQQEQLVNSETLVVIGEMASAVAHSIRNPLASIRSSAELAVDGDVETLREAAHDIMAESDRLGKWVRDLLTYSRPINPHLEKVDIDLVIQESLRHYASEFQKRGIEVSDLKPPVAEPWYVRGNASLYVQAFNSLFANAAEVMPNGGRLTVTREPSKTRKHLRVAVRDTGPGIPDNQLKLIFKPFHTTKRNGLGLGLPMVKRIVERFDGRIQFASKVGEGTTVSIEFLLVD